jgi:hypothetical protein
LICRPRTRALLDPPGRGWTSGWIPSGSDRPCRAGLSVPN